jgi:hypothetical protein
LQIAARAAFVRRVRQRNRGVALNGLKQVVEIVSDAAGEPSHRFHLLRMPQLFLEVILLGHITKTSTTPTTRPRESRIGAPLSAI